MKHTLLPENHLQNLFPFYFIHIESVYAQYYKNNELIKTIEEKHVIDRATKLVGIIHTITLFFNALFKCDRVLSHYSNENTKFDQRFVV